MRLPYWYHNLRSWIKYHPNKLRIKTLKRGWIDRDQQLLHACMQILVDFVETEKSQDIVDWEYDEGHRGAQSKMNWLYNWWKLDPFAQDSWLMPEKYDEFIDPYQQIRYWLETLYGVNINEMGDWALYVVKRHDLERPKDNLDNPDFYNKRLYYSCLTAIKTEAIKRQDEALKMLISIRGYLWT